MALVEDFTTFFHADDFAVIAAIGASNVSGIFDKGYAESFDIAGSKPTFICKVADLPAITLGTTTGVISGATYLIAETQPDGYGLTTLMLETV